MEFAIGYNEKAAVGYVRVSTEEQARDDRYGIEAQKYAVSSYANREGYKIVRWYVDRMSGASDDRPEWNRILTDAGEITNPPYEAVIVYKSDRVARDIKLYFYYLYVLEKRGVKLFSTSEDFGNDMDNGLANIFRSLMLFVAEQERKNITVRTTAGRQVKARAGGYSGGKPPYGYITVDGRLVQDPVEAEIVKTVFRLHDAGVSLRKIAEALGGLGYKSRGGGPFNHATVNSILSNERMYCGEYHYAGIKGVPGDYEPILKKADRHIREETT